MGPVSKLGQILAVARAKIKAVPQPAVTNRVGPLPAKRVGAGKQRVSALGWKTNLKASLAGLDLSDQNDCAQARRVLVQALLVRELGDRLLLDPQWPNFLEEVIAVVETDPGLADELNRLAHRFRGGG